MLTSGFRVFIVEDDLAVRDALGLLLGLRGYSVVPFRDAETFLQAYQPSWRGCALIDIRMPGMDGLVLQERLQSQTGSLPVIVITGHGDVESARRAFRAQAVDFLEKPLDDRRLMAAIEEAYAQQASSRETADRSAQFAERLVKLTPREREIMDQVVAGQHNRDIARTLNISPRTVEVHKARMLAKLEVGNLPDLVRLCLNSNTLTQGTIDGPAEDNG